MRRMTKMAAVDYGAATLFVCCNGVADDAPVDQASSAQTSKPIPLDASTSNSPGSQATGGSQALAEVVVTANKRKETGRKVAGGVTAITKEQLEQAGASSMADYLSLSPGVNFDSGVPGYSVITIRGVSSDSIPGFSQTAVGTYYDDIPLTDPAAPISVPDIDAFDADRIEILRGPQGALYGSASLGGAVNYIPSAPDLSKWLFRADASGDFVQNSVFGGGAKLMVNAPIWSDDVGLRAVAYLMHQPGYIDNIGTGIRHSNSSTIGGGRVSLGWAPTKDSTLKVSALYQRTYIADTGFVLKGLGDLENQTIMPEPNSNYLMLGSLRYEINTNFGSLAFINGYQEKASSILYDGSSALGAGSTGLQIPLHQFGNVKGYSNELRFTSPTTSTFNWLAGLSYVYHNENFANTLNVQDLTNTTSSLDSLLGDLGIQAPSTIGDVLTVFDEYAQVHAPEEAMYFDGSYRLFHILKFEIGGRFYRNLTHSDTEAQGLVLAPTGNVQANYQNDQKAEGFNPKASLSLDVTNNLTAYVLYSRGYRLGGPNLAPVTPLTSASAFYNPDKLKNYEFGVKSRWWHGRLTFDIAAYENQWINIPLEIEDSVGLFNYLENAGDAKTKGIESALAVHPFSFLTTRTSVSYTDARLLNYFNPNNGRPPAEPNSQLPGAPLWTISNMLVGQFSWGQHDPNIAVIQRYVSGSPSNLSYQDVRLGNYELFDVRAGMKIGAVGLTLFGKNIGDRRGVTAAHNYEVGGTEKSALFIVEPRSLGVELTSSFGEE